MTEFWKSNPRKFCDFCKCWFSDNKASKDFHERGKRHQENVTKKIGELTKKGQKQYETQEQLSSFLKQMEEGAMKAFKKDVAENPDLLPQYKVALVEKRVRDAEGQPTTLPGGRYDPPVSATGSGSQPSGSGSTTAAMSAAPKARGQSEWVEAVSPEGHKYFWNTVTGASQWEKPENFIPEVDDVERKKKPSSGKKKTEDESSKDSESEEEEEEKEERSASRGMKRRSDAYGGWSSVSIEPQETPDLQLPEASAFHMSSYVPQAAQYEPREKLAFKEKTVGSIAAGKRGEEGGVGAGVSFKKRKAGGRQIRSRDTTS